MKASKQVSTKTQQKTNSPSSEQRSRSRPKRKSLRVRIALGVALPILLILVSLSLIRYRYAHQLLEEQIQMTALHLGEVVMGSLRYAMLADDHQMLAQALNEISHMEAVQRIQIVNLDKQVKADTSGEEIGIIRRQADLGCRECHQYRPETRPRTTRLAASAGTLRIAMPLANDPDCAVCHIDAGTHLGMLLVDMPTINIEAQLRRNLQTDLAFSITGAILVIVGLYLLINRLVVRRVEAFRPSLTKLAGGDFTTRMPVTSAPADELDDLVAAFNRMAGELERRAREKEERSKLEQQAVAKERGRIARELHDGLAQLLGYVNTKTMAVRLMLKNHQTEAADQTLQQLEEAARELFANVREAISGLKMAEQDNVDLPAALEAFTTRFSRLNDIPVELAVTPTSWNLPLPAETKQQLLRIAQEALTNVSKHASASGACVSLQTDDGILTVTVSDDGKGFDPNQVKITDRPHFGLSTMKERAELIGAEIELNARPGDGTRVTVRLPLKKPPGELEKEEGLYAYPGS